MEKKSNIPRLVRNGEVLTSAEARNIRVVAGQSQPDPLPEPPSELEELRDKVDFYKRNLRRVNLTLNNVLRQTLPCDQIPSEARALENSFRLLIAKNWSNEQIAKHHYISLSKLYRYYRLLGIHRNQKRKKMT